MATIRCHSHKHRLGGRVGRLGDSQSLQRHLFTDAIGRRMEVTVIRNGALVDAVVWPSELPE